MWANTKDKIKQYETPETAAQTKLFTYSCKTWAPIRAGKGLGSKGGLCKNGDWLEFDRKHFQDHTFPFSACHNTNVFVRHRKQFTPKDYPNAQKRLVRRISTIKKEKKKRRDLGGIKSEEKGMTETKANIVLFLDIDFDQFIQILQRGEQRKHSWDSPWRK